MYGSGCAWCQRQRKIFLFYSNWEEFQRSRTNSLAEMVLAENFITGSTRITTKQLPHHQYYATKPRINRAESVVANSHHTRRKKRFDLAVTISSGRERNRLDTDKAWG